MLLAGLGSVMLIASQIATTPSASSHRIETAQIVNELADELRFATHLVTSSPTVLDCVVADRNADGTAERIRYEWSGTPGDPLTKSVDGGAAVVIAESVQGFSHSLNTKVETTTLTTNNESAETLLLQNGTPQGSLVRTITPTDFAAQQISPVLFAGVPANATAWNATRVEFQAKGNGLLLSTLAVGIFPASTEHGSTSSHVLGWYGIYEWDLGYSMGWKSVAFPSHHARGLALHRGYTILWITNGLSAAADLLVDDTAGGGALESNDTGASWQYMPAKQIYYRLYGTYTTPGPTYNVDRTHVTHANVTLQTALAAHSRVDAAIPMHNTPELLSAYWRTDFDTNPTTTNSNGDADTDWAASGSGILENSVWKAGSGVAIETRPLCDFTKITTLDFRFRNTSTAGKGAVMQISADRQAGLHAPLITQLQLKSDGTQTLTLLGKTSDSATKTLFIRSRLPNTFIRLTLTIYPNNDLVNLRINGEDQGTFAYPTFAPSDSYRFVKLLADATSAEFDFIDVRVAAN